MYETFLESHIKPSVKLCLKASQLELNISNTISFATFAAKTALEFIFKITCQNVSIAKSFPHCDFINLKLNNKT